MISECFYTFYLIFREYCDTVLPTLNPTGKEITLDEVEKQTSFIPWLVDKVCHSILLNDFSIYFITLIGVFRSSVDNCK